MITAERKPFEEILSVLKKIRRGRLDSRVTVMANDEIGYTGDAINDMAAGLRERESMRQSLNLAKEVQLTLLPKSPPRIEGLDIAARIIYCDQTGGDYFRARNPQELATIYQTLDRLEPIEQEAVTYRPRQALGYLPLLLALALSFGLAARHLWRARQGVTAAPLRDAG